MDSQHRHELKENDLEQALRGAGRWWSAHGRTVLFCILVLLGAGTAFRWYSVNTKTTRDKNWDTLALATTPDKALLASESAHTPGLRNLARLRAADLWLSRAALPNVAGDPDADARLPAEMLEEAERVYKQILNDQAAAVVFRLNAMLGLASVAESQQRWEDAAASYDRVMQLADKVYPAHATIARKRRDMLDRLKNPVVFAPEPVAIEDVMPETNYDLPTIGELAEPLDMDGGEDESIVDLPAIPTGEDDGFEESRSMNGDE